MKKVNKFSLVVFVISIISIIPLLIIYNSNRINALHNEYRELKASDSFYSQINGLYVEKGVSFVTLDSIKIILDVSRNYKYDEIRLSHTISIGDTIIKNKGSYNLIVRKANKDYHFVIGQFINKPK